MPEPRKNLRMLETTRGKDGSEPIRTYVAGESYEVGVSLFAAFVTHMRVALSEEAAPDAPEDTPPATSRGAGRATKIASPTETKPAATAKVERK